LENVATTASIFDRDAQFVLDERHFSVDKDKLRKAVDGRFMVEFSEAFDKMAQRFGSEDDLVKKTQSLSEHMRKEFTRSGLNIICRNNALQDFGLIRRILKSGFVAYSGADIEYLRQLGEWEDIPLIISSVDRPDYSISLWSITDDSKYRTAARAIYSMGRGRLAELFVLEMPSQLLSHLIVGVSDKNFRTLTDNSIIALFLSEHERVRKAAALKCVRSLPKGRVKQLLDDYVSPDKQRYYNVIHWLDPGISVPRDRALQAVEKVIVRGWRS
jgi:hypothetical protein